MEYTKERDVDRRLLLLSRVTDPRAFLEEISACDTEGLELARAFFDVSTEGYEEVKDDASSDDLLLCDEPAFEEDFAAIVAATEDAASTIFHALRDKDVVKRATLAPIVRPLVPRADLTMTQLADFLLDAHLDLNQLDTIVAHALQEPSGPDPFYGRPRFGVSSDWRDKLRRANGRYCTRHHPDPGGGPCLVGVDFDTLDTSIGPP